MKNYLYNVAVAANAAQFEWNEAHGFPELEDPNLYPVTWDAYTPA